MLLGALQGVFKSGTEALWILLKRPINSLKTHLKVFENPSSNNDISHFNSSLSFFTIRLWFKLRTYSNEWQCATHPAVVRNLNVTFSLSNHRSSSERKQRIVAEIHPLTSISNSSTVSFRNYDAFYSNFPVNSFTSRDSFKNPFRDSFGNSSSDCFGNASEISFQNTSWNSFSHLKFRILTQGKFLTDHKTFHSFLSKFPQICLAKILQMLP